MSGLLDLLTQQLSGSVVQQMSKQIGADPASTQKALTVALPLLVVRFLGIAAPFL